jgi:hypothetical protein
LGHIPFGTGADAGVLFCLTGKGLSIDLLQSSVEAVKHRRSFPGDVGELAVGESG